MLGSERDFIQEPANQEDGRLVTQNNHLVGAWLPGSFLDQRWWGVGEEAGKETKKKDYSFNPCKCPLEWQASVRGMC